MSPQRDRLGAALRDWRLWAIVVLLSLAFRSLALVALEGRLPGADTPNYIAIAHNMLAGRGIVLDDPYNVSNMRVTYPPLMPLLLAAVGAAVPLTLATITVLNTAIDFICGWLMTRLGTAAGAATAGRLAAAIYLLWPTNLGMAPLARKEGLIALLVVAQLVALIRIIERRGWRPIAGFGVAAGLTALAQPALATLSILFGLLVAMRFDNSRRWLGAMTGAALCAVMVLTPWWVRNWLAFKTFIPFTIAGDYSLWIGSTPTGDGNWVQPPDRFRTGDEFAMAAAMGSEARAYIAANPGTYLRHCLEKLMWAFASDYRGVGMLWWAEPRAYKSLAIGWGAVASVAQVVALQVGLIAAFFLRRWVLSGFLLACFAQILLFGMWFEFDHRHRYFLTPVLLLAACQGALAWSARRKGLEQTVPVRD